MTATGYDSHIRCYRTNQMLARLTELLHAPEGAFRYQEGIYTAQDVSHRIIFGNTDTCTVVLADCNWKAAWRFLAVRALDEVVRDIQSGRDDGRFYDYSRSTWHTPETLAESIYDRICQRIFIDGESLFGFRFRDVTDISKMTYEGDTAYGSLLFLPNGAAAPPMCGMQLAHSSGREGVLFQRSQWKYIRKLLAGIGIPSGHEQDRQALVFCQESGGEEYHFVGYISEKDANQFPIRASIMGNGRWIFSLAGQDVLHIQDRQVRFPTDPMEESREALRAELQLISKSEGTTNGLPYIEQYERFLEILSRQRHGTSAIFLDLQNSVVAEWMDNLEIHYRAQRVEPWSILELERDENKAAAVGGISRIDGCFIVDYTKGTLEFINVIVDGKAMVDGFLDSGSRRNSIPCFLANLLNKCPTIKAVAFLFSEDGNLTVVRGAEVDRQLHS